MQCYARVAILACRPGTSPLTRQPTAKLPQQARVAVVVLPAPTYCFGGETLKGNAARARNLINGAKFHPAQGLAGCVFQQPFPYVRARGEDSARQGG